MEAYKKMQKVIKKVINHWNTLREFVGRKSFQNWFSFTVVVFSVLSTTFTYAQQITPDTQLDGNEGYTNVRFTKEAAIGNSDTYDNYNSAGNGLVSTLTNVVGALEPSAFEGYSAAVDKYGDELSASTKLGLTGTIENLNTGMLQNHPRMDVVAHLANEWVPGYDETYTAIYAQDGYSYLQSINITDLWESTRMIAYAGFVLVLIAAGFMIMFRQKIGGQMMVTVFNTIPKLVIGLILVTFSFAFVGIIMDIGAVLIRVVSSILGTSDPIVVSGPFSLIWTLFRGWGDFVPAAGTIGVGALVVGLISGGTAFIVGGIIALVVALVVIGILAMASVKVFITLLKAYIGIIMDTVLAPIYLTISVIPGQQSVGRDWLFRVFKNVATFVGVFFIVNLAAYLRAANVDFTFPRSLAGGEIDPNTGTDVIGLVLQGILPIFLYFMAAEVPNFLSDFFPQAGGKGSAAAFQGVQKSFGKIPLIGGMLG